MNRGRRPARTADSHRIQRIDRASGASLTLQFAREYLAAADVQPIEPRISPGGSRSSGRSGRAGLPTICTGDSPLTGADRPMGTIDSLQRHATRTRHRFVRPYTGGVGRLLMIRRHPDPEACDEDRSNRPCAVAACGPLHSNAASPGVAAVGERSLRRENEQARQRIDELEAQLTKSQESINQLLEQVRELTARVAEPAAVLEQRPASPSGSDGGDSQPKPKRPRRRSPNSLRPSRLSPRRVFSRSCGSPTPRTSATSACRSIHRKFADATARSGGMGEQPAPNAAGQIEWLIEVRNVVSSESPMVVEYRVLDRETRLPYSERLFAMQVPARFERRCARSRRKPGCSRRRRHRCQHQPRS